MPFYGGPKPITINITVETSSLVWVSISLSRDWPRDRRLPQPQSQSQSQSQSAIAVAVEGRSGEKAEEDGRQEGNKRSRRFDFGPSARRTDDVLLWVRHTGASASSLVRESQACVRVPESNARASALWRRLDSSARVMRDLGDGRIRGGGGVVESCGTKGRLTTE